MTSIPEAERFLLPTPPVVREVVICSPAEDVADWELPFMMMIELGGRREKNKVKE